MIHEDNIDLNQEPPEGDGIIFFNNSKNKMAIVTADCLPIYIQGKTQSALIHAGWKGVYNKIVLQDEVKNLGAQFAHIGPHIRQCCFEVTEEFKDYFPEERYFEQRSGKLYFNLEKVIMDQLIKLGKQILVDTSNICTCCQNSFHSYRRSKTKKRNWNIISTISSNNI